MSVSDLQAPLWQQPIFPAEIIDGVLDHLHDDKRTLAQCAVSSKVLLDAARFHLFRDLVVKAIHEPHSFLQFAALLGSSSTIFPFVRHLRLVGDSGMYSIGPSMLALVMGRCTALKTLTLDVAWDSQSTVPGNLSFAIPRTPSWNLDTLAIEPLKTRGEPLLQALCSMLCLFASIKSLRLRLGSHHRPTGDLGTFEPEDQNNSPLLEHLSLQSLYFEAPMRPATFPLCRALCSPGTSLSLRRLEIKPEFDGRYTSDYPRLIREVFMQRCHSLEDLMLNLDETVNIFFKLDYPYLTDIPFTSILTRFSLCEAAHSVLGACICELEQVLSLMPHTLRSIEILLSSISDADAIIKWPAVREKLKTFPNLRDVSFRFRELYYAEPSRVAEVERMVLGEGSSLKDAGISLHFIWEAMWKRRAPETRGKLNFILSAPQVPL